MIKAHINSGKCKCSMDGNGMMLVAESVMMVRGLFVSMQHYAPRLAWTFQRILTDQVTSGEIFSFMDGEVSIDLKKASDGHGD